MDQTNSSGWLGSCERKETRKMYFLYVSPRPSESMETAVQVRAMLYAPHPFKLVYALSNSTHRVRGLALPRMTDRK